MSESESPYAVDLYVRSLAAGDNHARIEETLARLEELKREDAIDDYTVHVWGEGVSLTPQITATDTGGFIRERVAAFREWAHETGRTLTGFREHTTSSAMTGRAYRNLRVPAMALCERSGEDIEWVAPCEDQDSEMISVTDRLAAIEENAASSSAERVTPAAE